VTPQTTEAIALRSVASAMEGQNIVGIAVSGGGDSMALLHLAMQVGRVAVVTVDHGLRANSANEAAGVARFCAAHRISHDTLQWQDRAEGNLQAAARDARYRLMADWARMRGIGSILLGHTADDRAETFLMRLGREAGLDGLGGMSQRFNRNGIRWHRPLLDMSRADLRQILEAASIGWVDDPSNDDTRFERVRARRAMQALAPLGITAAALGRVMAQLTDARDAIRQMVAQVAPEVVRQEAGDLCLDWPALARQPHDIRRRVMVEALMWMTGAPYPPRREELSLVMAALEHPGQRTLAGCLLRRKGPEVRISREPRAVRDTVAPSDGLWDGRWRCDGHHAQHLRIRALGTAGLAECPGWRDTGLPRNTLLASPAIWDGPALIAAPLAGCSRGWSAQIVADFASNLLSH
jgi:tRNA(Ile)-lysidine synthase